MFDCRLVRQSQPVTSSNGSFGHDCHALTFFCVCVFFVFFCFFVCLCWGCFFFYCCFFCCFAVVFPFPFLSLSVYSDQIFLTLYCEEIIKTTLKLMFHPGFRHGEHHYHVLLRPQEDKILTQLLDSHYF